MAAVIRLNKIHKAAEKIIDFGPPVGRKNMDLVWRADELEELGYWNLYFMNNKNEHIRANKTRAAEPDKWQYHIKEPEEERPVKVFCAKHNGNIKKFFNEMKIPVIEVHEMDSGRKMFLVPRYLTDMSFQQYALKKGEDLCYMGTGLDFGPHVVGTRETTDEIHKLLGPDDKKSPFLFRNWAPQHSYD